MTPKAKAKIKKELKMKKCRYCLSTENLTIDHKIPKSQGGTDDTKNLQCLCKSCNTMKSSLSHRQVQRFAQWIYSINERRAKLGKAKPIFSRKQHAVEKGTA